MVEAGGKRLPLLLQLWRNATSHIVICLRAGRTFCAATDNLNYMRRTMTERASVARSDAWTSGRSWTLKLNCGMIDAR